MVQGNLFRIRFSTVIMIIMCFFRNRRLLVVCDPAGACPLSSVSRCFAVIFLSHARSSSDLSASSSCQVFEPIENCFSFVQCTDMEMAQLAAIEYFKIFKIFIPKEAMIAFRFNLRNKCQPHCVRNAEHKCRLDMKGDDRDRDNALVLELHAVKLQLYLRVTDPKDGCPRLETVLARINYHRKNNCKIESMWCLCKHVKDKLHGVCAVNCGAFKDPTSPGFNNSSKRRRRLTLWLMYCFSLMIIYYSCFSL